jgi:N-acetyltransferase 10|tara:strand:- start:32577 stop:35711 length:3135 start_codon:yes stop_codon:yes gene_type:complete
MRKKVDARIRTLVENGVKKNERTMFVLVGDRGRDQIVNLHYMLSKAVVKSRPNVLWCYKKDLYLSSHKKKRAKQIKKMQNSGLMDAENEDPFSLFVASTNIRYCYYAETQKILGNTYGMAVLQDFEALTPNLLARTIETVEGGGLIVLLLSNMQSLTQLYNMTMDVHSRFRTEGHQDVVARFNERFTLSLGACPTCIMMDDELNILPISSHIRGIEPMEEREDGEASELTDLKESMAEVEPAGPLVGCCKTMDQAKAVVTFLDAASEKTLRSTVALTAARGRGKSAAMGIAVAGAVEMGYANIFVTSPSPENLKTFFDFILKGFDSLGYKEHLDYDLVESTNPAFGKCLVRINVTRRHRQTIQYILPQHAERATQAELLVIDEAAAIPLPTVKSLLGPYLVFLCSTINGYEGTGRALSIKLISNLRREAATTQQTNKDGKLATGGSRLLREVALAEPVRYSPGDRIEKWLNDLLCLDAADALTPLITALPPPSACELYEVSRDTLFSAHSASEQFLKKMMALYVSSHYRNTPNDLQLMSDAPAHRLFVLLAPVDETQNVLPEILCVIQVALEGAISQKSARATLAAGLSPQGDLIPWTMASQFQDEGFPSFTGVRIVRIAVHPDLPRQGYGSRAIQLIHDYYEGKLTDLREDAEDIDVKTNTKHWQETGKLTEETLKPREDLPPLLTNLSERKPENVNWIGTSFGLTPELYSYWSKGGYKPVYLRQTASETTGEHTCIMLRPCFPVGLDESPDGEWVNSFYEDFRVRFTSLMGSAFRDLAPALCLSLMTPKLSWDEKGGAGRDSVLKADNEILSPHDLRRIQKYSNALVDHHLIGDLVPPLARAYFAKRIPVTLSYTQAVILLILGLQLKTIDDAMKSLELPGQQIMALFNKSIRRIHGSLLLARETEIAAALPSMSMPELKPHAVGLDEELDEGYVFRVFAPRTSPATVSKRMEVIDDNIVPEFFRPLAPPFRRGYKSEGSVLVTKLNRPDPSLFGARRTHRESSRRRLLDRPTDRMSSFSSLQRRRRERGDGGEEKRTPRGA